MRVVADVALCEGHGVCTSMAPEVFDVGDEDHVEVLQERPDEEALAKVEAAVRRCPKQALSLVSD
jgi:ferredoxin